MNRFLVFLNFAFIITIFGNCKTSRDSSNRGESIEYINTLGIFRKSNDSPPLIMNHKVWYQDSLGVTEICRINIVDTDDTTRSTFISTIGYRYVNLKRKWAYEYEIFADTASIKRKYRYNDTTEFIGGWNFERNIKLPADDFRLLSDTIINNLTYKRYKVRLNFKSREYEGICWFRCDKKNTYFNLEKSLSDVTGCTNVFFRMYPVNNPTNVTSKELKFISNNLPDSVKRVFKAWKKNENIYPVQ